MTTDSAYKKRLNGWLSYAFASEAFVIVSLTLFLPICLEQFARDNGFLLPDKTEPCISISVPGTGDKDLPAASGEESTARCVVKLGWWWVDSASFSLYVYSISVALQALTVISMGGIADYPPFRKRLLLGFAVLGSSAAMLFLILPSSSPVWFFAALLAITANVGFGASFVAMNAFLPSLAKDAPEVKALEEEIRNAQEAEYVNSHDDDSERTITNDRTDQHEENGTQQRSGLPNGTPSSEADESETRAPLIQHDASTEVLSLKKRHDEVLSQATSRISSMGVALGFGAGITMAIVALIPVTMLHGSTFSLRLAIALSGLWWAFWTIPAAVWLPGGRGSANSWENSDGGNTFSVWVEIVAAWKRLGRMLSWSEIVRLKNTFKFLAAWFLLSDGFNTITSTALLFAKTTLNMPAPSLLLIGILAPLSGILGSLAWPLLQKRYKWSNLKILTILVIMISVVPAYGCIGFLPIFQGGTLKFGGLTKPAEMFVLAIYFGSSYGAFQGYARAFFAELIPPGEEARWFALFSVTDKSSSFFGPLVVGAIADLTGNIRYAFFFLTFLIWLAVPILSNVDVEEGRVDARAYVQE